MVGEIRDQETAQIAINSALTDIWSSPPFTPIMCWTCWALSEHGRGSLQLRFRVELHSGQRLVRQVCDHCRHRVEHSDAFLLESGLIPAEWRDVEFVEGAGCFDCGGTGYRGRTAYTSCWTQRQDPRNDSG